MKGLIYLTTYAYKNLDALQKHTCVHSIAMNSRVIGAKLILNKHKGK